MKTKADVHDKIIGLIELVWGTLHLLGGLIVLLIMATVGLGVVGLGDGDAGGRIAAGGFVFLLGVLLTLVIAVYGIPTVIAGWGLIKGRKWARILTIIIGICNLFHFPLGTCFGVYVIWAQLLRDRRS